MKNFFIAIYCDGIPFVQHSTFFKPNQGSLSYSPNTKFRYNSELIFTCDVGYNIYGNFTKLQKTVCLALGEWILYPINCSGELSRR